VVCAGDHGAARAGVSAYPQDVTWQMVENFLAGGAAINALAGQAGMQLVVADAGVAHDFGTARGLIDAKVGAGGTANYLEEAGHERCRVRAGDKQRGAQLARDIADTGCNVLGFGEMGIGNTAAASLLTHCLTGLPLALCVGRGTGLDDAGLARKQALLAQALAIWPLQRGEARRGPMRFACWPLRRLRDRHAGRRHARRRRGRMTAADRRLHRHLRAAGGVARRAAVLLDTACMPIARTSRASPCSSTGWAASRCSTSGCAWARAPAPHWPCRWSRRPAPSSTKWRASSRPASATRRAHARQLEYFFAALRFFTRLPTPAWVGHGRGAAEPRGALLPAGRLGGRRDRRGW
jgi:hypothetical protein